MGSEAITRKNFWIHLSEGAIYLSSGVLLSPQTVFPALVVKLGGDNIAVGAIPIVAYLMYYIPQIISANYIRSSPFRRAWTLRLGILQRVQVLLLAIVLAVFGQRLLSLALGAFYLLYIANQILAGLGSPVWFDLVAKTTTAENRGKLMGVRTSVGAIMGFLNGFLLTALLAFLPFPLNFSAVFAVAFLLQFTSWMILRNVTEIRQSTVVSRDSIPALFLRVKGIVGADAVYRRFLISAAFLIVGLMPTGFFIIAAIRKYNLQESYVGLFTIILVAAQAVSGAFLGWLADKKGHKISLVVCALATGLATLVAIVGNSPYAYFVVFFFVGVNLGAEAITRYNFVERCAREHERPLYVGIMNAWIAPFYLSATLGGWIADQFGYLVVFAVGLVSTVIGTFLLIRIPDPSRNVPVPVI